MNDMDKLVELCRNNMIFNEQDLLSPDFEHYSKTNKVAYTELLTKFSEFREYPKLPPTQNLNFSQMEELIGINEAGVYEIVGDNQSGKTFLINKLLETSKPENTNFLITSFYCPLTSTPELKQRVVFTMEELFTTLALFLEFCIEEKIYGPRIFIDDLSVILYEIDQLVVYMMNLSEFSALCLRIKEQIGGVIIGACLPKKDKHRTGKLGSIIPSPWRSIPLKVIYVEAAIENLLVETIDNFTGKSTLHSLPIN